MHSFINKAANLAGVDRAIAYSIAGKVIGIAGRLITLFLVVNFLSEREQGFYYTFASVLALTMFLDLGLTNVLQVFASHEKAKLVWGSKGVLTGDEYALARIRALLRLGVLWFGLAAVLVMLLLYPGGILFFSSQDAGDKAVWLGPWLFAAAVTATAVFMGSVTSVLTGCGRIKEMRMLSMIQPLIGYPVSWLVFIYGGGLFAGPAFFACGLLVTLFWLFRTHSGFLAQNVTLKKQDSLHWREIWPLQWRTALNWMGGYFIFQFLNPLVFALFGPVEAGRMGMSLMLVQQIATIGFFWVNTKPPAMGMHWANGEYRQLDRLFCGAVLRGLFVCVVGCSALIAVVYALGAYGVEGVQRMLSPSLLYKVALVQIFNTIILSESLYLRANKREPFVWVSLVQGMLIVVVSWSLGRRYGLNGMLWGQVLVAGVGCVACTVVMLICRKMWQSGQVGLANAAEATNE